VNEDLERRIRSAESLLDRAIGPLFARRRQDSLPAWAPADRFDHFYRLAVNTRRAEGRPAVLRVGDAVRILGVA
jgi:hypothetical protein